MLDTIPIRPATEPLVVDAKRLAKLLNCSLRTIRNRDARGLLPTPLRIGGSLVWRRAEVDAWLEAGAPIRERWNAIRANKNNK